MSHLKIAISKINWKCYNANFARPEYREYFVLFIVVSLAPVLALNGIPKCLPKIFMNVLLITIDLDCEMQQISCRIDFCLRCICLKKKTPNIDACADKPIK